MKLLKVFAVSVLLLLSPFSVAEDAITINVNTADEATLAKGLYGVGPEKAKAIVAYRKQYGEFKSVADLTKVSGVGEVTLEKNRDRIVLGGDSSLPADKESADGKGTQGKKEAGKTDEESDKEAKKSGKEADEASEKSTKSKKSRKEKKTDGDEKEEK